MAYLAVVMDLFARKSVGWTMSLSPDTNLTGRILSMAFEERGRPKNVIFHSGQGVSVPTDPADSQRTRFTLRCIMIDA